MAPKNPKRIRAMSMDEILSSSSTTTTNIRATIESEEQASLDQRLGEELNRIQGPLPTPPLPTTKEEEECSNISTSPLCVPLLTPPQSPRRQSIELEWPSNLVVDNALMAVASDIRPLSPASLVDIMEDDENDGSQLQHGYAVATSTIAEQEEYKLTKRLSFIRVGSD